MALSGDDLRYLRRKVGSSPDDATLQTTYDAYVGQGKTYPLEWTILDTWEVRYADLLANPATFAVSGEYSQSTGDNIDAILDAIKAQRAYMTSLGIDLPPMAGDVPLTITPAAPPTFVR